MDNKTYLDQIAVKGNNYQKNSLLSPNIIKLIIGAVIALIAIIIVAAVLNANNNKPKTLARSLYIRTSMLSSETGPLNTYGRKIKNSELRNYNSQIKSALNQASTTLSPILENMKVSTEIDEEGATCVRQLTRELGVQRRPLRRPGEKPLLFTKIPGNSWVLITDKNVYYLP